MDVKEAAIRARNLLTEQNEAVGITLPHIQALVPTALETWARMCFESREKRELFKERFVATTLNGQLDLSTYLDGTDGRINLKELRETTIYYVNPDVEVEDAGFPDANGNYLWQGIYGGKPYFVLIGEPDNPIESAISWDTVLDRWTIYDNSNNTLYYNDPDVEPTDSLYPWEVITWIATVDGVSPPLVSGSPNSSLPFTWLTSFRQLANVRPRGLESPACWLDGYILKTRSAAGLLSTKTPLTFTVTNFPAAVTNVPKNLEQDFVTYLAMVAVKGVSNGDS